MRLLLYSALSLSSFLLTTTSALSSRPNFYSAAIHLGRSSASLMVLANFGVWCGVILGIGIKKVFFGRLRGVEYEVSIFKLFEQSEKSDAISIFVSTSEGVGGSLWSVLGRDEKSWDRS
jgi:hypothetical protein